MRIAVMGGGVMGRLWAGRLSASGESVTVVDTAPEVVAQLLGRGIVIEERDGSVQRAQVQARTAADGLPVQDVVFFFTKTEHTASAAELAGALVGPGTAVVTLQNGFGNADVLASHYGPDRIVHGPTEQGGGLTSDGRVFHAHEGSTVVGPFRVGASTELAERVAGVLAGAGVPATAVADVTVPLWRKRVFGAAVFPIAALTGLPAGELVRPDVFPAIAALAAEAVEEARAAGADLDLEQELERFRAALIAGAPARASMLQDLEAGRRTEVDAVTGVMAELADGRGACAPVTRAVVALVHGREHAWEQRKLADTTTRGRGGNTPS